MMSNEVQNSLVELARESGANSIQRDLAVPDAEQGFAQYEKQSSVSYADIQEIECK
jgi:hypothetical protein